MEQAQAQTLPVEPVRHRACQFVVFKIADKVRAGLIAIVRRFGQSLGDNRTQTGMDGYIQIAWRDRGFVDDLVNDRGDVLADEWLFAGQHLIQDYAQAEEIGAAIERAAFHLLRSHVVGRAQHLAGVGYLPAGFRNAEVHDLHRAVGGDHDVGRLYVTMNNSVGVRVIQAAADLPRKSAAPHPWPARAFPPAVHAAWCLQ